MSEVLVMVGTRKGGFFFWSDQKRHQWRIEGPLLKGWEVCDFQLDRRGDSAVYAAVGHAVYGSTLHVSRDVGKSWSQIEHGPAYPEGSGRQLNRVWTVAPGHPSQPQVLYAGVDEAGLFVSRDSGESWHEVTGLNDHPSRSEWMPGAGGLCCHTILIDPQNPRRMWVGISAVGVFRTDDGGESWQLKNDGLGIVAPSKKLEQIGSCVHKMVLAPEDPNVLYQQNHQGVFRSADGGDSWERIEAGLPSQFGFPMVMHPADSRTLYVIPLESDEYRFCQDGRLAVYRTRDGGGSWQPLGNGLPAEQCYVGVLRNAMATDGLDQAGIYFGTSAGQVFYSRDSGDSWEQMPGHLPRVLSVTAVSLK